MKNTQGQSYDFEPLNSNTWILTGEPTLESVVKNNQVVTQDTDNVDFVNYSGNLTLSRGNTINGQTITQVDYISGVPQYVI